MLIDQCVTCTLLPYILLARKARCACQATLGRAESRRSEILKNVGAFLPTRPPPAAAIAHLKSVSFTSAITAKCRSRLNSLTDAASAGFAGFFMPKGMVVTLDTTLVNQNIDRFCFFLLPSHSF